jgi:hypothetical protein
MNYTIFKQMVFMGAIFFATNDSKAMYQDERLSLVVHQLEKKELRKITDKDLRVGANVLYKLNKSRYTPVCLKNRFSDAALLAEDSNGSIVICPDDSLYVKL